MGDLAVGRHGQYISELISPKTRLSRRSQRHVTKPSNKSLEVKLTSTDGFTEALNNQGLELPPAPSLWSLNVADELTPLQSMTAITTTYGIVSLPLLPRQPLPLTSVSNRTTKSDFRSQFHPATKPPTCLHTPRRLPRPVTPKVCQTVTPRKKFPYVLPETVLSGYMALHIQKANTTMKGRRGLIFNTEKVTSPALAAQILLLTYGKHTISWSSMLTRPIRLIWLKPSAFTIVIRTKCPKMRRGHQSTKGFPIQPL